jgi:hypothetical protein
VKLTPALERLADEIATADRIGLSAGPEKLREWAKLLKDVVAGASSEWLPESAFRLRTGAHVKWCRRNFTRCERAGVARKDAKGRREWNVSARPPRARATDAEARVAEIVRSFAA